MIRSRLVFSSLLIYFTALPFALATSPAILAESEMPAITASQKNSWVTALCISGDNRTATEKRFVDRFAQWTCDHFDHSLVIRNGIVGNEDYRAADALLQTNLSAILATLRKSPTTKIDLYIFGHSNIFGEAMAKLLDEQVPAAQNFRPEIRFVYNAGCENYKTDQYFQLHSRAYVGHMQVNYGPVFSPLFLTNWFNGMSVGAALKDINAHINQKPFTSVANSFWSLVKRLIVPGEKNDPRGYATGDLETTF